MSTTDFDLTILGTGFSAVALLENLSNLQTHLRVAVIGDEAPGGLAYGPGAEHDEWLLNVPVERMGLFQAQDFFDWCKTTQIPAEKGDFMSRSLYGRYLVEIFEKNLAKNPNITYIEEKATELTAKESYLVVKTETRKLSTSQIVMCLGHKRLNTSNLKAVRPNASVLILGSGLTMIDYAQVLIEKGGVKNINVFSRHKLKPKSHLPNGELPDFQIEIPKHLTPREYLKWTRSQIKEGIKWPFVIDAFRPHTQSIWQEWGAQQRKSFLRHLRSYWDNHRHRCSPQIFQKIQKYTNAGYLKWLSNPLPPENFDVVLDCTGTDLNHHPLFLQAVEQGLIKLDELNLGFETDQFGQSVVQDGVFILGPQLRAHFWECTAVPELREQAKKLARQLLNL